MRLNIVYVIILIIAPAFSGCSNLPRPDYNPPQAHLTVLTYNINWGVPRADRVINYLSQCDADIIFLQETHEYWQEILENSLTSQYPHQIYRPWYGAGGIAILSQYRLSDIHLFKPEAGWFPALYAKANTPIGKIGLLNVHLRPGLSDKGSVSVSAYLKKGTVHKKELERFVQAIDLSEAIVIAGDFNENDKDDGVKYLEEKGFTNSLPLFNPKTKTWYWKTGLITLSNRYDHILFSGHLDCTGAGVSHIKASDHMPVRATIIKKQLAK